MKTSNGEYWMVYHAYRWDQVESSPGRVLCIDKIHWSMDSKWPFIGIPSTKPELAPIIMLS